MSVDASDTELTRADLRRAQVLDASVLCFGRSGFHGASMADIAAEASMSVGQIYRYFASKEAIIAAIVARDFAQALTLMDDVKLRQGGPADQIIELVRHKMAHMDDPIRTALSLEILAEAARNPRVAEILREADETGRAWLRGVLTRHGVTGEYIEARMDMISMLVEGWTTRRVRNPNVDRDAYLASLRHMLNHLFSCTSETCG
jgi:AcrR family transcriptional regulator